MIEFKDGSVPEEAQVLDLYRANKWNAARDPDRLMGALSGSHGLITAYDAARLVGVANAISDGHLVVYYPHILVHPDWQGQGIGRAMVERLTAKYADFHQQTLFSVASAPGFYQQFGFREAENTVAMWIYERSGA